VHLTRLRCFSHLYAKHCQSRWKFDKVMEETIFTAFLLRHNVDINYSRPRAYKLFSTPGYRMNNLYPLVSAFMVGLSICY